MPDEKARIEIEVALRDAISAGLKSVSKEFDYINKTIAQTGNVGISNFTKSREQLDRFREKTNESNKSLGGLHETLLVIGKTLGAGAGIAATLYQAAKSLETFASGRIGLQQFARTTGFTVENIEDLQQAFQRLGISTEQGDSIISRFGSMFDQMEVFKTASELWQELNRGGKEGTALANRVQELVSSGRRMEAIMEIAKKFDTLPRTQQVALALMTKSSMGELQGLSAAIKRNVPPLVFTDAERAEQEKFHNKWIDITTKFNQKIDQLKQQLLKSVVDTFTNQNQSLLRTKIGSDKGFAGPTGPGIAIPQSMIQKSRPELSEQLGIEGIPKSKGRSIWERLFGSGTEPQYFSGAPSRGEGGDVLEKIQQRLSGHSTTNVITNTNELRLEQTDKENSGILKNIRDTLIRIEGPPGEQKFAMGSHGEILHKTKAHIGEMGPELVTLPGGRRVLVNKPLHAALPAGASVKPVGISSLTGRELNPLTRLGLERSGMKISPRIVAGEYGETESKQGIPSMFYNPNEIRPGQSQFTETSIHEAGHAGAKALLFGPAIDPYSEARAHTAFGMEHFEELRQREQDLVRLQQLGSQAMHSRTYRSMFKETKGFADEYSASIAKKLGISSEGAVAQAQDYQRYLEGAAKAALSRTPTGEELDRSALDRALTNSSRSKVEIGVDFGDVKVPNVPSASVFKSVQINREPQASQAGSSRGDVNRFSY